METTQTNCCGKLRTWLTELPYFGEQEIRSDGLPQLLC